MLGLHHQAIREKMLYEINTNCPKMNLKILSREIDIKKNHRETLELKISISKIKEEIIGQGQKQNGDMKRGVCELEDRSEEILHAKQQKKKIGKIS